MTHPCSPVSQQAGCSLSVARMQKKGLQHCQCLKRVPNASSHAPRKTHPHAFRAGAWASGARQTKLCCRTRSSCNKCHTSVASNKKQRRVTSPAALQLTRSSVPITSSSQGCRKVRGGRGATGGAVEAARLCEHFLTRGGRRHLHGWKRYRGVCGPAAQQHHAPFNKQDPQSVAVRAGTVGRGLQAR